MSRKTPEVDRYIAKSAPFAQPILTRIREAFLDAHPDIQEVIKWGAPHFDYKGMLGSMAAFKQHVTWGFWKASLMSDPARLMEGIGDTSMGRASVRELSDLPSDKVMRAYIAEAIRLNDEGVKVERKPKAPADRELVVPDDLQAALARNSAARKTFEGFPPGQRREYVDWIVGAKQDATRRKRLETTIEWLAEGKRRNWKYER